MPNVNPNFIYVSEKEKELLIAIAAHDLDGDCDNFQVSLPQLMLCLGKSRATVIDLRVPCIRKGILEIVFVGTGNRASIYKLNLPRSKMKCNTTIVLDVKTSETSGVAYEKISSIAI